MGGAFLLIAIVAHTTGQGNLDHIKSKTVGDGQHGTARWATKKEIQQTFKHIPFRPLQRIDQLYFIRVRLAEPGVQIQDCSENCN